MKEGAFRSDRSGAPYSLERFINRDKTDFYSARSIINGLVPSQAHAIAGYARHYLDAIKNSCME